MTFQDALKAEIGDTLVSVFNNSIYNEGDEVILIDRARDHNGISNDTGGYFYRISDKLCHGGNIQDFNLKLQTNV